MEEAEFSSKFPDFKSDTLLYYTAFDVLLQGVKHITHIDAFTECSQVPESPEGNSQPTMSTNLGLLSLKISGSRDKQRQM